MPGFPMSFLHLPPRDSIFLSETTDMSIDARLETDNYAETKNGITAFHYNAAGKGDTA